MKIQRPRSVTVIGGGPSGAAVATHLVRAGIRVGLYKAPKRPDLLIGESLIPAVITHLRDLGVEDEIAAFSTFKPGATFYLSKNDTVHFDFSFGADEAPGYAYNCPRDQFDACILRNAEKNGVKVFSSIAEIEYDKTTRAVSLSDATMAASQGWFESQPDFIIDASGRSRFFAKLFQIPFKEGRRRDAALFAHFEDVDVPYTGHIHVNRLERGWSWRIPLPGKTSVGIVAPFKWAEKWGNDSAERYDAIIKNEPHIAPYVRGSRLTKVMKYSNYQLISDQMYGPNWAMVGDAAGFIDPVFSSGLLLTFVGAKELAATLTQEKDLEAYQIAQREHMRIWQFVVDLFYDGRFFGLVRLGRAQKETAEHGGAIENLSLHLTRILTGAAASHPETQQVLQDSVARYLSGDHEYRLRIA